MKMMMKGPFALALLLAVAACDADSLFYGGHDPSAPQALDGYYYAYAVHLNWELDSRWSGESFRVYGKRSTDRDYFLVAEVTSCAGGTCGYTDRNVSANVLYDYYVSAVDVESGAETASSYAVEVFVPHPTAPPAPGTLEGIGLDDAIYLRWDQQSRDADDFHFYRVYLDAADEGSILLGETDSEGFLDLLVENGSSYRYFLTAVDREGHESSGSQAVEATPRPDFHGEFLYAHEDRPDVSGFRFQESETTNPIRSGTAGDRHFRLEVDNEGWWLVPGPGVQAHRNAFATTALRCGPASDAGCVDLALAPESEYGAGDVELVPGYSYVVRVPAESGGWRYGVIRVTHTGWAQDGAIALFDWAFQLQVGNRALTPPRDLGTP